MSEEFNRESERYGAPTEEELSAGTQEQAAYEPQTCEEQQPVTYEPQTYEAQQPEEYLGQAYQAQQYQTQPNTPYDYYNKQTQDKKGMSIASMVLGIIGLVMSCVPVLGFFLSVLAIVFGAIGMNKGNKGMAIAGIVCGTINIVLHVIFIIFLVLLAAITVG